LRRSIATLLLALVPATTLRAANGLVIRNESVDCVVAGRYPRLKSCVEPLAAVVEARLYFRAPEAGA